MAAWTERERLHTYWDGPERVGCVSSSTSPSDEPVLYVATFRDAIYERVSRPFLSLDAAKRWIELAAAGSAGTSGRD